MSIRVYGRAGMQVEGCVGLVVREIGAVDWQVIEGSGGGYWKVGGRNFRGASLEAHPGVGSLEPGQVVRFREGDGGAMFGSARGVVVRRWGRDGEPTLGQNWWVVKHADGVHPYGGRLHNLNGEYPENLYFVYHELELGLEVNGFLRTESEQVVTVYGRCRMLTAVQEIVLHTGGTDQLDLRLELLDKIFARVGTSVHEVFGEIVGEIENVDDEVLHGFGGLNEPMTAAIGADELNLAMHNVAEEFLRNNRVRSSDYAPLDHSALISWIWRGNTFDAGRVSFYLCDDCGEVFRRDLVSYYEVDSPFGTTVCQSCIDNGDYVFSERRDCWVHVDNWDDSYHDWGYDDDDDDDDGRGRVDGQFADGRPRLRGGDRLLSYSSNVLDYCEFGWGKGEKERMESKKMEKQALFFGLEIEMEFSKHDEVRDLIYWIHNKRDVGICVSDGSLRHGMELVTAPRTLASWREDGFKELGIVLSRLRDRAGAKAWDKTNCGQHIHFSRAALTPLQLGKFLEFMNRKDNQEVIAKVCGRKSNGYCNWNGAHKIVDFKRYTDKYSVVNLQRRPTVEVRLFRGNVGIEGIRRNVDVLASWVQFVKTAGMKGLGWNDWVQWLGKERGAFPLAWALVVKLGLAEGKVAKFDAAANG